MADPIRCRDACGRAVANQSEAEARAWSFLEISKGWRCPDCARALREVNERTNADLGYVRDVEP